jgi:hypothetical protein
MASGRVSKVKGKVLDIPSAPTIGTATAGGELASITFTASTVGGPYRSYIAKSNPSNITATGSTSPINVTGLTAGTSYTISVAGVNETGTGEYSSASNSITPTVATSFESISTVTVGSGGSASASFTSIPATYKHLQIRYIARSDYATAEADFLYSLNSDTTSSNYNYHRLIGTGAATYSQGSTSSRIVGNNTGSSATSGMFSAGVIDILDYASTDKYKTIRNLTGIDRNGAATHGLYSNLWRNSAAISSITLTPDNGNWAQYTQFALYGIKGA